MLRAEGTSSVVVVVVVSVDDDDEPDDEELDDVVDADEAVVDAVDELPLLPVELVLPVVESSVGGGGT